MLEVSGIADGIVIDHIHAGRGLQIFDKLELEQSTTPVVLLMGVRSERLGKKDIIKIEGRHDVDLNMLALIDPGITISHIKGGIIVEKLSLTVPEEIQGVFECSNPRCISRTESLAVPRFRLKSKNGKLRYSCNYCEEITEYRL